jgi:hypothetical protein
MPKHPLSEAQRRHKTGEAARIQKLANSGIGEAEIVLSSRRKSANPAYVKARVDGGLTIGRGANNRLVLDAEEAADLIATAQELLAKPSSPHATTPAKAAARMTRWVKPQPNEAKT